MILYACSIALSCFFNQQLQTKITVWLPNVRFDRVGRRRLVQVSGTHRPSVLCIDFSQGRLFLRSRFPDPIQSMRDLPALD